MLGFRIIHCSKLEPQTPSEFSLQVAMIWASLDIQADRRTLGSHSSWSPSPLLPRNRDRARAPMGVEGRALISQRNNQSAQPTPELMFQLGPHTRQLFPCPGPVPETERGGRKTQPCISLGEKSNKPKKEMNFLKTKH